MVRNIFTVMRQRLLELDLDRFLYQMAWKLAFMVELITRVWGLISRNWLFEEMKIEIWDFSKANVWVANYHLFTTLLIIRNYFWKATILLSKLDFGNFQFSNFFNREVNFSKLKINWEIKISIIIFLRNLNSQEFRTSLCSNVSYAPNILIISTTIILIMTRKKIEMTYLKLLWYVLVDLDKL